MKKLLFVLCLGVFLGACASVSNVESDTYETGKRPTLSQIHKNAEILVAVLEEKKKEGTLTDEEKELVKEIEEWKENKTDAPMRKYASRPLTAVDMLTAVWAGDEGYSLQEIDKYLQTGFYVKNPYCDNEFKSFQVFQVLPDYVLTYGCKNGYGNDCDISWKIFLFFKQNDELYFDKKILTPPVGYCPTYVGIHQYTSKDENVHTVPMMAFFPKIIAKDHLDTIQKMREESQKLTK